MNVNSLFVKSLANRLQLINYQTVRWRKYKKPFWLGVAKSKKFVVPQPRVSRTAEERMELQKIGTHYDTHMKSILNFIRNENPLHLGSQEEGRTLSPSLDEDISKSWTTNENFNAESARRREERLKVAEEEEVKKATEVIESIEEERRKHLEFIEEIVRKEKALSQSYVTPENVDEAIEKCLKDVKTYDFAIDLNGNRYPGREPFQLQQGEENKMTESSSG